MPSLIGRLWFALMASILLGLSIPAVAACEATASIAGTDKLFAEAWGTSYDGQRYQPAENTSINAANAATLELQWAYGLATDKPRSAPLITEDTIFIGDGDRGLVALARDTGCERWVNDSVEDIATAIVPAHINGRTALVFTERRSGVHAVDAQTGKSLWHSSVADEPLAMYSGTPLVYGDKVFVPLSSQEIALAMNPFYSCCSSSGGMAALDAATGKLLWHRPSIEEPAIKTGEHLLVVDKLGPSGAPVWGAPTLDTQRQLLFFGTGQNYSHPATLTSDAIFAVHTATGAVAWVKQFTANDTYNMSCEISTSHPNCPEPVGPDVDFGAPPLLVTVEPGRQLLYAGQKSGDVYAIAPDTGATVWTRHFGEGGKLGGVHWGMAANAELGLLFVPISDFMRDDGGSQRMPGLFALDLRDGSIRWSLQRSPECEDLDCWTGLSAAVTAGPDFVVTGGLDGVLEIVRAADGATLWSFDTAIEYDAVNKVATSGGAMDTHGPALADDLLVVTSGYGSFRQTGGNALLVFKLRRDAVP